MEMVSGNYRIAIYQLGVMFCGHLVIKVALYICLDIPLESIVGLILEAKLLTCQQ